MCVCVCVCVCAGNTPGHTHTHTPERRVASCLVWPCLQPAVKFKSESQRQCTAADSVTDGMGDGDNGLTANRGVKTIGWFSSTFTSRICIGIRPRSPLPVPSNQMDDSPRRGVAGRIELQISSGRPSARKLPVRLFALRGRREMMGDALRC
jgi:hypothetical protein